MDLKALLAAKKAQTTSDDSDLVSLTAFLPLGSSIEERKALQVLLFLLYNSHHKTNLLANDFASVRILVSWLGPFNSLGTALPYEEPIPKFLQSFLFWNLASILDIAPARLWREILQVLVEAEKFELDKNPKIC